MNNSIFMIFFRSRGINFGTCFNLLLLKHKFLKQRVVFE